MSEKKEIRNIQTPAKVEERKDGTPGSIYGYPIVYDKDFTDDWMGFTERIAPGAAKKALKRSDIRGLKNHEPSLIFGRQGVNMKFKEDEKGLYYEAAPIDTRNYRETAEEVRLGLLTGQSFGFTVQADEWTDLDTDKPKRTITEIGEIFDVGPVTYPAYQDTSVALRSMEAAKAIEKPVFSTVGVTIGDAIFDINDVEGIDKHLKSLRSGLDPMIPDPGIAEDALLSKESAEMAKDFFKDIDNLLDRHKE